MSVRLQGEHVSGLDRNPSPQRADNPVALIADVTDIDSIGTGFINATDILIDGGRSQLYHE